MCGNGNGDEARRNLCGCSHGTEEHAIWRWLFQDKCMNAATWSFPNTHKMRQNEGEQVSHNSLSIWVDWPFLKFQFWIYKSMTPPFIVEEGWKWKGKIQTQDYSNLVPKQVTKEVWLDFFLWHLLKLHLHLLFMSHGKVWLIFVHLHLLYLYLHLPLCYTKKTTQK